MSDILVDPQDIDLLNAYPWKIDKQGYVYRSVPYGRLLLHREILKAQLRRAHPKAVIDHINGNKSDNRRSNLRIVTQRQNLLNMHKLRSDNKSGVTGVHWFNGAWVAFYGHRYLGRFPSIQAAQLARAHAART